MTIIAYTYLESGLLTGKYHKNPELLEKKSSSYRTRLKRGIEKSRSLVAELETIGTKYNATAAQVALNWMVSFHGETIVTMAKVRQAEESAGAMRFRLSDQELDRLDELSRTI